MNFEFYLMSKYMGEFSKRIGEIGEEIVVDFLSLIGWHDPARNFDIPSIDPEKHGKKTHGIDAYFHYQSPMIARTLENVLISTKYSKDKYPNAPINKFVTTHLLEARVMITKNRLFLSNFQHMIIFSIESYVTDFTISLKKYNINV